MIKGLLKKLTTKLTALGIIFINYPPIPLQATLHWLISPLSINKHLAHFLSCSSSLEYMENSQHDYHGKIMPKMKLKWVAAKNKSDNSVQKLHHST